MGNFKEDIARTEAFVFDVDGVFTDGNIMPLADGDFLRAYRAQLNLYAIAIEKRFAPKKVTYKGIYSFALGKLIEA